jgi:TatA/E family protein of Tat protein translocase
MPFNIGAPELIIILVIALLVLGPGKLPDVGAALGKSIREFRKATSDIQEGLNPTAIPPQAASAQQPPVAPPAQAVPAAPASTAPAPNTLGAASAPNTLTNPDQSGDQSA